MAGDPDAKRRRVSTEGPVERRIGIVGFGKVGSYLVQKVLEDGSARGLKLVFVCDLFAPESVMSSSLIPEACKVRTLDDIEKLGADLIVEVAHPNVSRDWGVKFLQSCDYMLASTTAFADPDVEVRLMQEADRPTGHGLYITAGALFGALDIQKMSDGKKLAKLHVIMKKDPESLYPVKGSEEFNANEAAKQKDGEVVLYEGPVRQVAKLFPVNVNTICTAALAARSTIGMDGTTAKLVADRSLEEMVIEVKAEGPKKPDGSPGLRIHVLRENPSVRGEVTGLATLASFYASVVNVATSHPRGDGLHLA